VRAVFGVTQAVMTVTDKILRLAVTAVAQITVTISVSVSTIFVHLLRL
jgi:hypothetical protein